MASRHSRAEALGQPATLWRVGHPAYPLWTGLGAALHGGRWNSPGRPVIYASAHYSLALLEVLANLSAKSIPHGFVRSSMQLAKGVSVERVSPEAVPNWRRPEHLEAIRFGDRWLEERRSLLLFVPSAVVEGIEENVLINPNHAEFANAQVAEPVPIDWDLRLFPAPVPTPAPASIRTPRGTRD